MLLDDIAAYLLAQGVATSIGVPSLASPTGWPCYLGYLPDDQDQMLALFETVGLPPDTINRDTIHVSFQFRVRGDRLNYSATHAKWQLGFNTLQDSVPAAGYAVVQAVHYGPMSFNDDRGRTNLISNFRVIKFNN